MAGAELETKLRSFYRQVTSTEASSELEDRLWTLRGYIHSFLNSTTGEPRRRLIAEATKADPIFQQALLHLYEKEGFDATLDQLIVSLLQSTMSEHKRVDVLALNQTIAANPVWSALLGRTLPPKVMYELKAKSVSPDAAILDLPVPPLYVGGRGELRIRDLGVNPDYLPVFLNLYHHLESLFANVSPAVLAEFLVLTSSRPHNLKDYILWDLLTNSNSENTGPLSKVFTYSSLEPTMKPGGRLWDREVPFTDATLKEFIVEKMAEIFPDQIDEVVGEFSPEVNAYLRTLLGRLWTRLNQDPPKWASMEEAEKLISYPDLTQNEDYPEEVGPDEGPEGPEDIKDFLTSDLFPIFKKTLLENLPLNPTIYDVDTTIAFYPTFRNFLGEDLPIPNVSGRVTYQELKAWGVRVGPPPLLTDLSAFPKKELSSFYAAIPVSNLSRESEIKALIGPALQPHLPFLLKLVNHFEDLFRNYSDEEVEAWVTANLADKFPTAAKPKSPRHWLRDLVLGLVIGGALRYAGSPEKITYSALVASATQNPYFDLAPYLKITKLD